jgi:hypothetical protein
MMSTPSRRLVLFYRLVWTALSSCNVFVHFQFAHTTRFRRVAEVNHQALPVCNQSEQVPVDSFCRSSILCSNNSDNENGSGSNGDTTHSGIASAVKDEATNNPTTKSLIWNTAGKQFNFLEMAGP